MGFFFAQEEKRSLYSANFADILKKEKYFPSFGSYFEQQRHCPGQEMLWGDLMTYLPDDILVKIDRMSMACSLETRSPLLDHELIEFMAQVPRQQKFTISKSKRLLRVVARKYLPAEILTRPKQGFAIPLARWLQTDLRSWMEELLLGTSRASGALFSRTHIQQMVDAHMQGRRDYSQQLWALLMLELWLHRKGRRGDFG